MKDGEMVIAVRRPTTIDSDKARARSRQLQQVEGSKLKCKWSKIDVYDSEFADVGGDISRKGASCSRIRVRAVKHMLDLVCCNISC